MLPLNTNRRWFGTNLDLSLESEDGSCPRDCCHTPAEQDQVRLLPYCYRARPGWFLSKKKKRFKNPKRSRSRRETVFHAMTLSD
uniref:Uncharacterized protein n=1 Tax=Knipowitschia caucasica TaxID=637954 RepID=A0AAV2LH85_KNICA